MGGNGRNRTKSTMLLPMNLCPLERRQVAAGWGCRNNVVVYLGMEGKRYSYYSMMYHTISTGDIIGRHCGVACQGDYLEGE